MSPQAQVQLYTLDEVADYLRYSGRDRQRSVRRLFERHRIPLLRRDRGTFLVSDGELAALVEAMKCSPSASAAGSTTSVGRSVSVAKPAGSKSTLRAAIAARMPTGTGPGSNTTSVKQCCTAPAATPKG
ncbi:MAG: hypothetical protein JOZ80_00700 [Acidobacteriaceae bacterium]|nr:hypothetical protein [Acidobacteriaceae bacterium]